MDLQLVRRPRFRVPRGASAEAIEVDTMRTAALMGKLTRLDFPAFQRRWRKRDCLGTMLRPRGASPASFDRARTATDPHPAQKVDDSSCAAVGTKATGRQVTLTPCHRHARDEAEDSNR